ncbi:hypothetical protein FPOA_03421 [Fusarium poae]|uniref:HNH nuclease domain-containing protein n=1 Tax=Fusarium poae TaxID=36050 RepID=A0A1B8B9S9_FUSPO|nr:hypothetical protein FPOA_03421 [Fusarium poae]
MISVIKDILIEPYRQPQLLPLPTINHLDQQVHNTTHQDIGSSHPTHPPIHQVKMESFHKSDLRDTRELRYEYAAKVEERIRMLDKDYQLTAMHASIILLLPLQDLRPRGYLDHGKSSVILHDALDHISCLVGQFLLKAKEDYTDFVDSASSTVPPKFNRKLEMSQLDAPIRYPKRQNTSLTYSNKQPDTKESPRNDSEPQNAAKDDGTPGDECPQQHEVSRSGLEMDRCCDRDKYQCIFTNTSAGQAAHIMPFACNKNKNNRDEIRPLVILACQAFEAFFPVEAQDELIKRLVPNPEIGTSDRYWNMVYINNHLFPFWGRAFCGLKCLGISPHKDTQSDGEWDVRIQFNWLYRRSGSPNRLINLENDANGMKEMAEMQIKHEDNGGPAPKDSEPSIVSGHTVIIKMPQNDAMKCKLMLDLQWNLACIAAMSGGAEYPELLPKPQTLFPELTGLGY